MITDNYRYLSPISVGWNGSLMLDLNYYAQLSLTFVRKDGAECTEKDGNYLEKKVCSLDGFIVEGIKWSLKDKTKCVLTISCHIMVNNWLKFSNVPSKLTRMEACFALARVVLTKALRNRYEMTDIAYDDDMDYID